MGCKELYQILSTSGWQENESKLRRVASHIRACSYCRHGLKFLPQELIDNDPLSCEACRNHFPIYYEATRPEFPLLEMADKELIEVAIHLGHCADCQELYEELVLLSELEERDELVDL